MARAQFIDPITAEVYQWRVNHDTEQQAGRDRAIDHTANTSNVGQVRQQGTSSPLVFQLQGSILHLDQYKAMWRFYGICNFRTIFYRNPGGDLYEVTITKFSTPKKRGVNRNDPLIPFWIYTYDLEMEVLNFLSGPEKDILMLA